MSAMLNAMRTLTDPADTGAVAICLPQDVQGEAWDYPQNFFVCHVHLIERRPPDPQRLAMTRALIACRRRSLVIYGGGIRCSGAYGTLHTFVETL